MDAMRLVATVAPGATVREISTSASATANRVFRLTEETGRVSVLKVYGSPGRERREHHALEAVAGVAGVPTIIDRGVTPDGTAWAQLTDGGGWSLATFSKNLDVMAAAGKVLRGVHDSTGRITNLEGGIDGDFIASHYQSTVERLGRYRRKLQIPPEVLEAAAGAPVPVSGPPRTTHARPTADKFLVSENFQVMLVDWEWATLAPPEWDLSLATWSLRSVHDDEAAQAFLAGYGGDVPASRLESWTAYHAAVRLLEAGETRDGRLADLAPLVATFSRAVGASS